MSIARSLLSLLSLAMLAATYAKVTHIDLGLGGKCVKYIIDIPPRPVPYGPPGANYKFTMMSDGTNNLLKVVRNFCGEQEEEIATQTVEVCNDYPHSSVQPGAPSVRILGENVVSPIYASCEDNPECGPLFWKIEQQCRHPML